MYAWELFLTGSFSQDLHTLIPWEATVARFPSIPPSFTSEVMAVHKNIKTWSWLGLCEHEGSAGFPFRHLVKATTLTMKVHGHGRKYNDLVQTEEP